MESDFTATCCCPSPHLPPATDLDEEASALGNPTCEDAAINSNLQCNYHSVLPNARGFPHRGVQETTRSTVRSHFFKASRSNRCSSNLRSIVGLC